MQREFTVSKGLKFVYSGLAVLLGGFALFLLTIDHSKAGPIVLLIPISLFAFAFIIILNQVKSKVIISDTAITRTSAFSNKSLAFTEIKGCRIGQKVIYIEPISVSDSRITINNYIDLGDSEELVEWLRKNFTDLDSVNLIDERNKLLQDQTLGLTEEVRKQKISTAKTVAILYNVIGFLAGFILIFLEDDSIVAVLMLFYPILGILILLFSRGLIKFVSNSKRSVYPWLVLGFMMPIFIMLIKSFALYNISNYEHLWLPFIIITAIFFMFLILTGLNRSIGGLIGQAIFMLIISTMYGYGATMQINCVFDRSNSKTFQTAISNKYIHTGKGTDYYLTVNPWEPGQNPKDIPVSHSFYNLMPIGSAITVYQKKGTFNIPWYYIKQ